MVRIGCAAQPVINLMRDVLLESALVYGDETELQVLKEPGRAPQTKSYLWAQMNGTGPPLRLFGYSPGRGTGHALKLYAGMTQGAVLMTDGYEVYNAIAATHGLVHLGCWVHCRRYFIEAEDVLPKQARTPDQPATQFIAAIGRLHAAEARARGDDAARRQRLRARYSARVLKHNLYSLIETCKTNNVDSYAYLVELLRALPLATTADDYESLLPWKIPLPATRL